MADSENEQTNKRCDALSKLSDERWEAHRREHLLVEQAREIAAKEIDRRLGDMNELRRQIDSERGTFLKVSDYTREHKSLEEKLDLKTEALGKQIQQVYRFIWMALGAITALSFLIDLVWKRS